MSKSRIIAKSNRTDLLFVVILREEKTPFYGQITMVILFQKEKNKIKINQSVSFTIPQFLFMNKVLQIKFWLRVIHSFLFLHFFF